MRHPPTDNPKMCWYRDTEREELDFFFLMGLTESPVTGRPLVLVRKPLDLRLVFFEEWDRSCLRRDCCWSRCCCPVKTDFVDTDMESDTAPVAKEDRTGVSLKSQEKQAARVPPAEEGVERAEGIYEGEEDLENTSGSSHVSAVK